MLRFSDRMRPEHSDSRNLIPLSGILAVCTSAILISLAACSRTDTEGAPDAGVLVAVPKTDASSLAKVELREIDTQRLFEDPNEHLTFATALPDGGFLAASRMTRDPEAPVKPGHVFKISNSGRVAWRTTLPALSVFLSGGETGDGRYWVGGSTGGVIEDRVAFFSKDGTAQEEKVLTRDAEDRRLLYCVLEHEGDYLQSAAPELDQYRQLNVYSISLTNGHGERVWDQLTPFDRNQRMLPETWNMGAADCKGILLTADRHVLSAQQVWVMAPGLSEDEILRSAMRGAMKRPAAFLTALDLGGHEIARRREDDMHNVLLAPAPDGAILVETSYLQPTLEPVTKVDNYVHIHWLDSSLRDRADSLIIRDGIHDDMVAVFPTPKGGLLLAGCSGTTSRGFVRYISSDRAVSPAQEFPHLGECLSAYWFARGPQLNRVLLLGELGPARGTYLATLELPE